MMRCSGYSPIRDSERLQESIAAAVPKMREAFAVQRQLATDRETLRQWELQQRYFLQHFGEVKPLHYRKGVDVAHLYDLRNQLADLADGDKGLGMLSKLLARFVRGIGKWSDFAASPVELELRVSRTIFAKEIARLQEAIVDAENELRHVDADALMADLQLIGRVRCCLQSWRISPNLAFEAITTSSLRRGI